MHVNTQSPSQLPATPPPPHSKMKRTSRRQKCEAADYKTNTKYVPRISWRRIKPKEERLDSSGETARQRPRAV